MVNGVGSSSPNSTQADRHIYLGPTGKLLFGTFGGGRATTLTTTASYNDNAWHQVVATQGASGMALYVDGAKVASNLTTTAQSINGYWRVGGDGMSTVWPDKPTTGFFSGNIDEAAVYPTVLSSTQVANHYTLSGRTVPPAPTPPTTTTTQAVPTSADSYARSDTPTTNYGTTASRPGRREPRDHVLPALHPAGRTGGQDADRGDAPGEDDAVHLRRVALGLRRGPERDRLDRDRAHLEQPAHHQHGARLADGDRGQHLLLEHALRGGAQAPARPAGLDRDLRPVGGRHRVAVAPAG